LLRLSLGGGWILRVLVTGGAGFIGSHLVDRFLADGFRVRVLDSLDAKVHPDGRPGYLSRNVEFVQGDVTDSPTLFAALQDVDFVSHQAAYQDYMPDFSRFLHVNAVGTALIFELIVKHRLPVKKVIVASSQAVYGEGQYVCDAHGAFSPAPRSLQQLRAAQWEVQCPICTKGSKPQLLKEEYNNPYNQYAVSKISQEKTALGLGWLHGIPVVALRYSITQGPRQSLFNQYSGICRIFVSRASRGGSLPIYEDGRQTRDFVHIRDVVDANMLVLEHEQADFQAFNIGGGKAVSVLEYAQAVRKTVGRDLEFRVSGEYRRGDNRHSVSSIEKLERLGWKPKRQLSQILEDFIEWVEEIGGIHDLASDAYRDMKRAGVVLAASR
jgi:dTDP-L-rhamnose 4-epimerase